MIYFIFLTNAKMLSEHIAIYTKTYIAKILKSPLYIDIIHS